MRDTNQTIIEFNHDNNFKDEDFYLSKSNKHVFEYLRKWPNWEKNFINIIGEKLSGKTHLINIFLKKNKGIKFDIKNLKNDDLQKINVYENIILENITSDVNEKLLYSLLNIIEQDNKYIIITSESPIVYIDFKLKDLKSRTKNFLLLNIDQPDDELLLAIIIKNLSDRQIKLDKKLIRYIVERIERSYSKIHDFIYKIDNLSLKKKNRLILKLLKKH